MAVVIMTVGLARSGKSTVAHYLKDKHGFKRIGFSDYIAKELEKRGLEVTKENMSSHGQQFRDELGDDYLIKAVLAAAEGEEKVVISGVRLMREYEAIKEKFPDAKMIHAACNPKKRFERRADKFITTFEEFNARDEHDEKTYKMSEVFAKSDFEVDNNGTLEELRKKTDEIVESLTV